MREIKFRCWDTKDKEMIYQFDADNCGWFFLEPLKIHSAGIGYSHIQGNYSSYYGGKCYHLPKNRVVLMQYTGLKDKNGKEIYEGDIIKGHGVVEWRGGAWGYSNVMWNEKYEIIGNIYENPELLKA